MPRFTLRLKFALLLASFVLAIGVILVLALLTSRDVSRDLTRVRAGDFPQFVEANDLAARFDTIAELIESAVVEGERDRLEGSERQRQLFEEHLRRLEAVTPPERAPEVRQVAADFARYYPQARQLAELILADEGSGQGLGAGSAQVPQIAAEVSQLKTRLQQSLRRMVSDRESQLGESLQGTIRDTRERSLTSFAIGLAAAVTLLLLLVRLARRIVVPITALSRRTLDVAEGRFDDAAAVPYLGDDEVGDLAKSFRDMTHRLKETTVSKTYVDNIIHSMADTLVVIDDDGLIVTVNQATLNLLGYEEQELVGRNLGFICGEGWDLFKEWGIGAPSKIDFINNVETAYTARTGARIPMSFSGSVMRDESGRIQGVVCAAQDITDRKRAEEELRLARDAAEQANQAKSSFLANMSHELRTPLNAILGYSEMLQEEAVDIGQDYLVTDLRKIHAAGKHLLALINDVLDLSKIEAGKMDLYLETMDVKALVDDVVSTVAPLVDKKANTLEIHCPHDIGTMHVDVTKVRQALFNLLSNACKFTDNGLIVLSVLRQPQAGIDWLEFSVRDTGIGMTPAQLGKLFQAFSQADASTTRKYGGTGLGLAISRRFSQMMGGDITVDSELGRGTVFSMRIPAHVGDRRSESGTWEPLDTDDPDAPTVLVVDDEPSAQELLGRFLRKEGYRVAIATSGADGVRLAREKKPLAITLDVQMPGMDGWAVLAALKSDAEVASIPVVMVSMVDETRDTQALGAAAHLRKPIDNERLAALLRSYRDAAAATR